jgi:polyhydroxyalkanoate synthesis regulator protein
MTITKLKKYGNRKVYYPAIHKYVSLADVVALVMKGHEVYVEGPKGIDATRDVLAQAFLLARPSKARLMELLRGVA